MLKIKLARFGKRNQPEYRIVVNEAKDKRDGAYTALLGHYAPTQTPKILAVNLPEYKAWLVKGAKPTDTVAALVKRFESGKPFPPKKKQLSEKAKAKLNKPKEEAPAPAAEAAVEAEATPEETPAEAVAATEVAAPVEEVAAETKI